MYSLIEEKTAAGVIGVRKHIEGETQGIQVLYLFSMPLWLLAVQ
ncbi:hypothetical protein EI42_05253 [Thermosporothrix hazakensis]|jgi:hypothetical protein|uniref:Uncharacterized protein n=1 Tax=Thermosporothrix hazakensis TaxID=644383 RepID=A0A326TZJ8_THEHA|nr:hypothetical protein EI42_05253 [Thermosporothrix hazakensis]